MTTMSEYTKEDISITIGKNIRAARNALGWKQSELAERGGCLERGAIAKIESYNATSISIKQLSIIADTLGVPVYMLILRKEDWRNLAKIAKSSIIIDKYFNSEKLISPEDVELIEAMSKSELKKEKRAAVMKTKAVVASILGIETGGQDTLSISIEQSRTAGTAMATAMIPNFTVLNGLIAAMISA